MNDSGIGLGWHTIPDKMEDLKCTKFFYAARDCIGPVSIFRNLYRTGSMSTCEEENFLLWKCAYLTFKKGDPKANELLSDFKKEQQERWPKAGPNPLFPPRSQIPSYFQKPAIQSESTTTTSTTTQT